MTSEVPEDPEVLGVLEVQRTSAYYCQTFEVNDKVTERIVEDYCSLEVETIVDLLDLQESSFDLLVLPEVHHTCPPVASYWAWHPGANSWVGHPAGPSCVGACHPCPCSCSSWDLWALRAHRVHLDP